MKKKCVLLILLALLSAVLCASDIGSSAIIVYFSATGNTAKVAEELSALTGAEAIAVKPEEPYSSGDLNYRNGSSRASEESADASARPAILPMEKNPEGCGTVFVGFPIWFGDMPKALYTFFDSYDFSGHTIHPFCTSGSSGISRAVEHIRAMEPEAAVTDGRRIGTDDISGELQDWLESIQ